MSTKTENITLLPYRERVKLIQERMRTLNSPKPVPLKMPARVAAAAKLLNEWEQKNRVHMDAQRDAHRAKLHEIHDAMIVGDMPRAVALLQKLGT
jgi:hypothetical protein